ncbi:MAG: histidinol-phosphate transaminase [Clostridia bacterium]|nr:histidinol-phosphate transaminase [Clostridia bacterium]
MKHGGNVWQGGAPSDWLDYSANLRPEGAPRWVKDALLAGMENVRYYPDPTMRRARAALAEYLGLEDTQVLTTAGGISAIDLTAQLPASGALLAAPCFGEYEMLCTRHGLRVHKASLLRSPHEIGDPAAQVKDALFEHALVYLCNPLNPVGTAFTRSQVENLLRLVEDALGYLVVDEAFIEYCPQHSVVDLIARNPRLLVTGSMTKILGIPGVRLGYLCARPEIIDALSGRQITWELSCFAEAVACALPEHKRDILADGETNARRREQLLAGLSGLGVYVYPSEAAFVLADFGRPVAPLVRYLKEKHILVRECTNFDGLDDGQHLRLAVKDEASNERLLQALREAMVCAENL